MEGFLTVLLYICGAVFGIAGFTGMLATGREDAKWWRRISYIAFAAGVVLVFAHIAIR